MTETKKSESIIKKFFNNFDMIVSVAVMLFFTILIVVFMIVLE